MIVIPLCGDCRHLDRAAPKGEFRCGAFPDKIPEPVLLMRKDHREPIDGDHGIRFEPVPSSLPTAH